MRAREFGSNSSARPASISCSFKAAPASASLADPSKVSSIRAVSPAAMSSRGDCEPAPIEIFPSRQRTPNMRSPARAVAVTLLSRVRGSLSISTWKSPIVLWRSCAGRGRPGKPMRGRPTSARVLMRSSALSLGRRPRPGEGRVEFALQRLDAREAPRDRARSRRRPPLRPAWPSRASSSLKSLPEACAP